MDGTLIPIHRADFEAEMFPLSERYLHRHLKDADVCLAAMKYAALHGREHIREGESNEDRFERLLHEQLGDVLAKTLIATLERFYETDYNQIAHLCPDNGRGRRMLNAALQRNLIPILATNPVAPAVCLFARLSWAGLRPEQFAYSTTAENSFHMKPSPAYYQDLLNVVGAKPAECIMIGNDTLEDIPPAQGLGIRTFLVTDYLVDRDGSAPTLGPQGDENDLLRFLAQINQEEEPSWQEKN
ncbi:MAG: HAD family hydrolase [Oscillospiraceae bacterium]|nr:HAD family hydrolase [Oscillospiraceae bacterium]